MSTTCSQFHAMIPTPLKNKFCCVFFLPFLVRMATIGDPTTKHVCYTYSVAMKRNILTEAYAELPSVKRVARKYNVQPNQLRKWKCHFDDNGDSNGLRDSSKGVRVIPEVGGGRKSKFSDELIADLKQFFENSRDEDFSVSLRLMVAQAKLLSPTVTTDISTQSRIYR
jgi:transposase-like protein